MLVRHAPEPSSGTEAMHDRAGKDMYITYELVREAPAGVRAVLPKVRRVRVRGELIDWKVGVFKMKSGRSVHGVRIAYRHTRRGYRRKAFKATRQDAAYAVHAADVRPTLQTIAKVAEVPQEARDIRFHRQLGGLMMLEQARERALLDEETRRLEEERRAQESEEDRSQGPCTHMVLLPRWDAADDMGKLDRVTGYRCDACGLDLSLDEGREALGNGAMVMGAK